MNKKTIIILIFGILLLLVVLGFGTLNINKVEKDNKIIDTNKVDLLNKDNEDDIKFTKSKINVYLFWGDGCEHCRALSYFLDGLSDEYKDMFNLYSFETWNNQENVLLLNKFNEVLDMNNTGVPYLIIGKDTIVGFAEPLEDKIIKTLVDNYNSSERYDVYKEILEKK